MVIRSIKTRGLISDAGAFRANAAVAHAFSRAVA